MLERDQREKLKVWEDKTDPLEAWLNETEAEVESYEPIGFDLETIRAQRDQAQVRKVSLMVSEQIPTHPSHRSGLESWLG